MDIDKLIHLIQQAEDVGRFSSLMDIDKLILVKIIHIADGF